MIRKTCFSISILFFVTATTVSLGYDYDDAGPFAAEVATIPVDTNGDRRDNRKAC